MQGKVSGLLLVLALLGPTPLAGQAEEPQVPYVPTPMEVVHSILDLAGTTAADSVYDLGSGDGRIPIAAAERYGASGLGVELDSSLVALARRNAREAGVEDDVRFVRGDLFELDLRPASVVTLYLMSSVNLRLRPKLLDELRPGARVVSHVFDMGGWSPDSVEQHIEYGAFLYSWVVPADLEGRWRVEPPDGDALVLELDQRFQELCVLAPDGAEAVRVTEAEVEGDSVRFRLGEAPGSASGSVFLTGTADGNEMRGSAEEGPWSATRVGETDGSLERWEAEASSAEDGDLSRCGDSAGSFGR